MPPESQEQVSLALPFLLGTGIMILLAVGVVLFVLVYQKRLLVQKNQRKQLEIDHQKQLTQSVLRSEDDERKRIASNLHDDLGALLNTAKLTISRLERNKDRSEAEMEIILHAKNLVSESIQTVRSISQELNSSVLEKFGLMRAIMEFANQLNSSKSIQVTVRSDFDFIDLGKNQETQVFRILKEITTNLMKHAKADYITIQLDASDLFTMTVFHDGVGIDHDQFEQLLKLKSGLGLSNMKSRIESIGGELLYAIISSNKSMVQISLPYEN